MTQFHARISHENLPVPLKLENIIISLPLWIGLSKVIVLNTGWLCTFSNIDFGSFLTKKCYGLQL